MKKPDNNLQELRNQIDAFDKEIVTIVGTRLGIVLRIANLKRNSHAHIVDKTREKQVLERAEQGAQLKNVDRQFVRKLFQLIIGESRRIQEEIINEK